jgi:hypothetical protein
MTTKVEITNHPETSLLLIGDELTFADKALLARRYVELVDPNQSMNLYPLAMYMGTIRDNPTCTTVATGTKVLFRGEILPGRLNGERPHRLRKNETAVILRRQTNSDENWLPYITIRRIGK